MIATHRTLGTSGDWTTWGRAAVAVVAMATGVLAASADERWTQVELTVTDAAALERLHGLGFEFIAREVAAPNSTVVDVFVPASELAALAAVGLTGPVVHPDLAAFYQSRLHTPPERRPVAEAGFDPDGSMGGYFTLDEAVAWFDELQAAFPALIAPRMSIGSSIEGRDLWAWKVSARVDVDEDEPVALFMSLMHAREPAGMMGLLYFAEMLTTGYGTDPEATYLLDHRELWFIPVLNPDGYEYNRSTNPNGGGLWRKNRRDNGSDYGVDLNRNFSFLWGFDNSGSSPNTNASNYRGTAPFSEPESAALRDFVIGIEPAVSANTHAYGDAVIVPWDYANLRCPDDATFVDFSARMSAVHAYEIGTPQETLGYLINGGHDDYMYGEITEKPVVYGVTHEAGDSADGFWPASRRILPIVEETDPANRAFAWTAGPTPKWFARTVDDTIGGDGDFIAEPGERVLLTFEVRNHGLEATWGVLRAELLVTSCGIWIESPLSDFGVVAPQTDASNLGQPFVITIGASAMVGERVEFVLRLSDDRGPYPDQLVRLTIGQPTVLFADDFESGPGAWTLGGWGIENAGAGRAGRALSDSTGGTYPNGADTTAELASPLDLSAVGYAYVVFDERRYVDNDRDAGFVEVSMDGGSSWSPLAGEASGLGSGDGVQPAGVPLYDGYQADYRVEHVDLASVVGYADVRLRLRLRSNGSIRLDGWHVDDLRVLGYPIAPPVLIPAAPRPLLAARIVDDVALSWPPVVAGPFTGPADRYAVYRSDDVRARGGFAIHAELTASTSTDVAVVRDPRSFGYQVVAANCAGGSSMPTP